MKVVLGQDDNHLPFPVEYRRGKRNEPWAVKTKLGWTLSGPLPKHEVTQVVATCHVATKDDRLGAQIETYNVESYATRVNVTGGSREDKSALEQIKKTTKLGDGRYEVGLPWAEDNATIRINYFSAHSQFCSLDRRLEKDEFLKGQYEEIFTVDMQNGYVRQLEENELDETKDERQLYVPHHPVINSQKPKKARRVCNAAAKYKEESLNDKLLTGPDLLQNLVGINCMFREHQIALSADIEAMFLQMKVPPQESRMSSVTSLV